MKTQQLISAGFAITAIAAASIPTLGWTLLGEVIEAPVVAQAPASSLPPLFDQASAHAVAVALRLPEVLDRKEEPTNTPAATSLMAQR